jgi:thymidylate synthase (FAD)
MLSEVKKVAPLLFEKAGPACVYGSCSEGKMNCGKSKEVRARYKEMHA